VVADARHKSGAGDELLAAYDAMTEMLIGRPILEAARITPRAVEAFLRGSATEPAFPIGADADHAFYVIQKAIEACERPQPGPKTPDRLPWNEVGLFEKVRRIEAVLDQHVRPALAADGGGVDLVDLQGDELMIQYQGACGSCSSSIGGTLQFVQDAINNHLGTDLRIAVSGTETVESPLPI
jgi:NifU-like protein